MWVLMLVACNGSKTEPAVPDGDQKKLAATSLCNHLRSCADKDHVTLVFDDRHSHEGHVVITDIHSPTHGWLGDHNGGPTSQDADAALDLWHDTAQTQSGSISSGLYSYDNNGDDRTFKVELHLAGGHVMTIWQDQPEGAVAHCTWQ